MECGKTLSLHCCSGVGRRVYTIKVGLRDQAVSDKGEILINGVSVKLKGVNHHDTHPFDGYVISSEFMRDELLKMKKLNINAIRTSHYPPQPAFIEMCDELGFYVIDEADLETHGIAFRDSLFKFDKSEMWPCQNEEWKDAFADRAQRLYERDKNHSCVIMWSLGNESNFGENFITMSEFIRGREKSREGISRFVHYEGAFCGKNNESEKDPDVVDVVSRMYSSTDEIVRYYYQTCDKRPFIWCEYSHAMGNGPGDLADYWQVIERTPYMAGAFIWEWADHAAPDEEGRLCYGGDFDEETHGGNFCCDGLVFSDRSFKAGSLEAKAVYQPMQTELCGRKLALYNKYDFTDFSEFDFLWNVTADGAEVKCGRFSLNTMPHRSDEIVLDFDIPECRYGAYLNISMIDKDGNERAFTQHMLSDAAGIDEGGAKAEITQDGEFAVVCGNGFRYLFNTHYGCIESMSGLMKSLMKLSVWRAPTDNDWEIKSRWYDENYDKLYNKVLSVDIEENIITVSGMLAGVSRLAFFTYTAVYTFFADGRVDVALNGDFDKSRVFLPRLGFEFTTEESSFKYFGYGPWESYIDMHHGSKMGMYESTAQDEYVNYIKPQEHGNHYNTKYLKLGGFEIIPKTGMNINISEYNAKELTQKAHNFELRKNGGVTVRLDYKVSGIGSGSIGPQLCEQYKMNDEKVCFEFSILPVK